MGQIDKIDYLLEAKFIFIHYSHKIEDIRIDFPNNKEPINIDCEAIWWKIRKENKNIIIIEQKIERQIHLI